MKILILVCLLVGHSLAETKEEKKIEKRGLFGVGHHDGFFGAPAVAGPAFAGHGLAHAHAFDLGSTASVHTTITKNIGVPVPHPVAVPVEKHIPVAVPYKVAVPVDRPYPVAVPKPYPVPVDRPYAVPVDRPVPYAVPHAVPVPVVKPVAVPVAKPYPVAVPHPVPIHVAKPIVVAKHYLGHHW